MFSRVCLFTGEGRGAVSLFRILSRGTSGPILTSRWAGGVARVSKAAGYLRGVGIPYPHTLLPSKKTKKKVVRILLECFLVVCF